MKEENRPRDESRRKYLKTAAAIAGGAAIAGVAGWYAKDLLSPPSTTTPTKEMEFLAWSYQSDNVRNFLKDFAARQATKGVKVNVKFTEVPDVVFHDAAVTRLTSAVPTDILYMQDNWMYEFGKSKLITAAETAFPDIAKYKTQYAPFALSGQTMDGKLMGLSYYADVDAFAYNADHLSRAGIDQAPTTWDELTDAALAIKQQGICEHPIVIPLAGNWHYMQMSAFQYSLPGGKMFEDDMTPVMDVSGSSLEEVLTWLQDGVKNGLINTTSLECSQQEGIRLFEAGTASFWTGGRYYMPDMVDPKNSQVAEHTKMGLFPGRRQCHGTYGWTRFYALPTWAVDNRDQETLDLHYALQEFLGGKFDGEYVAPKLWALNYGLGFASTELWNDQDIIDKWSKFASMDLQKEQFNQARSLETGAIKMSWYQEFDTFARAEEDKAILNQKTPADACIAIGAKARELLDKYT